MDPAMIATDRVSKKFLIVVEAGLSGWLVSALAFTASGAEID